MLLNCGAREDFWEFLGLHGDQASQSWRKSTLNIHWNDWCWGSNIWPPHLKSQLIGKDLDARKDWRPKDRGQQRMRWLDSIINSMDMNLNKLRETVENKGAGVLQFIGLQRVGHNLETEQQRSILCMCQFQSPNSSPTHTPSSSVDICVST